MPATSPLEDGRPMIDLMMDVAFPWSSERGREQWCPTVAVDRSGPRAEVEQAPNYRLNPDAGTFRRIQAALEAWRRQSVAEASDDWDRLDISWALNHALGGIPVSYSIRGAALRPWVAWYYDEFVDRIKVSDAAMAERVFAARACHDPVIANRHKFQREADFLTRQSSRSAGVGEEGPIVYRAPDPLLTARPRQIADPPEKSPRAGELDLCAELPSLNRRAGLVFLPKGDYYIRQTISLFPGQAIVGAAGTRLIFQGPNAYLQLNRVPDGAAMSDVLDREVVARGALGVGRQFAALRYRNFEPAGQGLDVAPETLDDPSEWHTPGLANSSSTLENLTVVDERRPEDRIRPLLDALNGSWFRIRRVEFVRTAPAAGGASPTAAFRAGRYSPGGNSSDTSPYHCRVEHCHFEGFEIGADLVQVVTHQLDGSRFVVGDNEIGIRFDRIGYCDASSCTFEGRGGLAARTAILIEGSASYKVTKPDDDSPPPPPGQFLVAGGRGLFGRAEFRDNCFDDIDVPVVVRDAPDEDAMMFSMAANVVRNSRPARRRPTLLTSAGAARGLPLGDSLLGIQNEISPIAVVTFAATPDETPARLGSGNLLDGRGLWPGAQLRPWDGKGRSADKWSISLRPVSYGLGPRWLTEPAASIGGFVGLPAVRIELPLVGSRADQVPATARIQRFVAPPPGAFRRGDEAAVRALRRAASRALGGRPLTASCWIRTNIPSAVGRTGVRLRILRVTDGVEEDALTSGFHPGDERWALLTGTGAVRSNARIVSPRNANSATLLFAIELKWWPPMPTEAPEPPAYVEICTPFVGTSAYAQLPRRAWLTEAGGHVSGCIEIREWPDEEHPGTWNPRPVTR